MPPALLPTPNQLPQQTQPSIQLQSQHQQQPQPPQQPQQPQQQHQQHQQQHSQQQMVNKVQGYPQHNTATTLILRKVPQDLNRVEHIRQHFSQFGQIVDIKCFYENKTDTALVQFATNQQAFAAFKCPQSILNNRFIRIFWLSNYMKQKEHIPTQVTVDEPMNKKPVKDRLTFSASAELDASDLQSDINRNKENKLVRDGSSIGEMRDAKLSRTILNEPGAAEVTSTGEGDAEPSGPKNLSNNFNNLAIKQTGNNLAAQEVKKIDIAAAKAIQDENQKVILIRLGNF